MDTGIPLAHTREGNWDSPVQPEPDPNLSVGVDFGLDVRGFHSLGSPTAPIRAC